MRVQVILTYPNNDAGGLSIVNELNSLEMKENENIIITNSLGRYLYHGILAHLMIKKSLLCW